MQFYTFTCFEKLQVCKSMPEKSNMQPHHSDALKIQVKM